MTAPLFDGLPPAGADDAANSRVVRVALPVPIDRVFDYCEPRGAASEITPGVRVRVGFGGQESRALAPDASLASVTPRPLTPNRDIRAKHRSRLLSEDTTSTRTAPKPRSAALHGVIQCSMWSHRMKKRVMSDKEMMSVTSTFPPLSGPSSTYRYTATR